MTDRNPLEQRHYDKLTIIHNHGYIELTDVTIKDLKEYNGVMQREAEGVVVGGQTTNRLFSATSTKSEPIGEKKSVYIYGVVPEMRCGKQVVSLVFCG